MTSEAFDEKKTKGVKFWGKKGWIEVARGYFNASDPKFLPPAAAAADPNVPYETKIPHQLNFIESVRLRKDPVVPVEIILKSPAIVVLVGYITSRTLAP